MSRPPSPSPTGRVGRWVERVAEIWAEADDPDDVRTRKAALVLAVLVICVLAVAWVATYLALGLAVSATIPLAYQVISLTSLVLLARARTWTWFRGSQLLLMILLPVALQWSLGGFEASSAVSLWALVGALGATFFYQASEAIPWFLLFMGLLLGSGAADPTLATRAADIPAGIRVAFFVLNIGGVSLTSWLLLQHSVRAQAAALARSEALLLNILPAAIARRLKQETGLIAQDHPAVTVLFADVAGFTPLVERTRAAEVIGLLNEIFSAFDDLAERHGLEKIKTIGDAYLAVAGVPDARPDHARAAAEMALGMEARLAEIAAARGLDLQLRIGMAVGPAVAGVIGRRKFAYDVWGDTVNTASRMESQGIPGRIQVTEATYAELRHAYRFERRGEIEVKGKGRMRTYLLLGPRSDAG